MKKITDDIIIADLLKIDDGIFPIMMESGMHCLGCPSAQMETLKEACDVHMIDCTELVNKINKYLSTLA